MTGHRLAMILPWVVVGVVMVVLAAVAVVRLFMSPEDEPDDAATVQDVAAMAEVAAEDLDVAAGVGLLCEAPMDLYRMTVESTIVRWQTLAGVEMPEVVAEVSDATEGPTGSFVIDIQSTEPELADDTEVFRVFVESRDGRSCITGVGGVEAKRPTTRFSGGGYSRATSPPASPQTGRP